jgi:pyruvate/2-oxoglutarate dehydrogenase complex dihydrolipoamide dehydrogenase (E3) component/uncharacterized membrane protein YdjX (TVP38/TMEM64 family)
LAKPLVRLVILLVIVSAVVIYWKSDSPSLLTIGALKQNRDILVSYYEQWPAKILVVFFVAIVALTSFSLPGASILTIAAGAVFGRLVGSVLVSFASTIGATFAFLIVRFCFRDAVHRRFRMTLDRVNAGIRRDGPWYLLTLRLVPIIPFVAINLVMGVTDMSVTTFYCVTQVGCLLGTVLFVNAGTELGQLQSMQDILSLPLLFSLSSLGLIPFFLKKGLDWFKGNRVLAPYPKPKRFDYNVVVIGGGSAGLVSAMIAATIKAKVALIEKKKMGGDCLNTGCVPSKALIRSAKLMAEGRRATRLGFDSVTVNFDFARVMERVQAVIQKIEPHDSVERYVQMGVECLSGPAVIQSPYEVRVGERVLTTRNIIVATGAAPVVPPIPGLDGVKFLTSDNLWELRTLPARLLVLGAGTIGCELAQCFARFGSKVTMVERNARLLPREDEEVSRHVSDVFVSEGIEILAGHTASAVISAAGEKTLVCHHEGREVRLAFDEIIVALGRRPNVKGFGLEALGISLTERGNVESNEFLATKFPNLFVCGDVAGPFQFTHTAAHQAWYAAVNALFRPWVQFKADYRVIPWTTFTDPEVARVGINEREAREQGLAFDVSTYDLSHLDRAITDGADSGFIKVLTEKGRDRILGVTIVGAHAGEIIVEYVTAMKYKLGLNKVLRTVHSYPTFAEANKYAAGEWKRANAPHAVLGWLERFHEWRRH